MLYLLLPCSSGDQVFCYLDCNYFCVCEKMLFTLSSSRQAMKLFQRFKICLSVRHCLQLMHFPTNTKLVANPSNYPLSCKDSYHFSQWFHPQRLGLLH